MLRPFIDKVSFILGYFPLPTSRNEPFYISGIIYIYLSRISISLSKPVLNINLRFYIVLIVKLIFLFYKIYYCFILLYTFNKIYMSLITGGVYHNY